MTIHSISDSEIERLYDLGNNNGRGFGIGNEEMSEMEAAGYDGLCEIRTWDSSAALGQHAIGVNDDGHMIAIADIYGPWAVDITEEVGLENMAEVVEFVESHDDDSELEDEELGRVFSLAYGRIPDDSDREQGLWSLICAAVQ